MVNLTLPTQLKVTLLVEKLESGKFAASVYEFPGCRVESDTRETAIEQVQSAFLDRLKHIEAIPWNALYLHLFSSLVSSNFCVEKATKTFTQYAQYHRS